MPKVSGPKEQRESSKVSHMLQAYIGLHWDAPSVLPVYLYSFLLRSCWEPACRKDVMSDEAGVSKDEEAAGDLTNVSVLPVEKNESDGKVNEDRDNSQSSPQVTLPRKPCYRKETARCRNCSFRFKVRRQHSLRV